MAIAGFDDEALMALLRGGAAGGAPAAAVPPPSFGQRVSGGLQNAMKGLGGNDFALALLANSGYSPQKQSFGQIIGQSALQGRQMGQQRDEDAFKRRYMEAQMAAMGGKNSKLISVIGPDGKPILKPESEAAGMTPYAGGNDSRPSAFIQAYDRYLQGGGKLPMMDFAKEFAANNAQYPYTVGDINEVPHLVPRTNPGATATPPVRPLSDLSRTADAKRTVADATAAGKTTGEAVATAQLDLPRIEDNAASMLKILDRLETHPGRKGATGASSAIPLNRLPGTNERDFVTSLEQVRGKQFLEAYNTLKGGGAITEIESTKAESAISTIMDRGQKEESWLQAADDLRDVVNAGVRRAKRKARGNAELPSEPKKLRFNPATGKIE